MKKIYIETLGCSKNTVDSEQMLGILDEHYELAEYIEEADIVIVNTCSFINDAKDESIKTILEIASLKTEAKLSMLIVAGCLAQRYPQELVEEIPEIDAIVGTGNFFKILEIIQLKREGEKQKIFVESVDLDIPEDLPRVLTTPKQMAYLKVAEGCDNRCTYCIIPKLRGKYRSRALEDIIEEAKSLVELGVSELVIIAQDTSRYGVDLYGKPKITALLDALSQIEGLKWIRVHYMYPDIIDESMVDGFFKNEKVVNYFDIPIQHASDSILKKMNRRTSLSDIRQLIEIIRGYDQESVIRTTVIVGFPGETQEDFDQLKNFIQEVKFDRLGAFPYSNEEDTPAYNLPDHVEADVVQERYNELMTLQMAISEQKQLLKIGRVYEVVVEEIAEEGKIFVGRTAFDAPEIDGVVYIHTEKPLKINDYVNVKITDAMEYDLMGELDE